MSGAAAASVPASDSASARLRGLIAGLNGDTVTLGGIIDRLGANGVGLAILLVGAITLVPGIAPVFGVALCALSLGLLRGDDTVQVPAFLRRRTLDRRRLEDGFRRVLPRVEWLEARLPAPGRRVMPPILLRAAGLATLVNAILIVLPVPFGNTAPAIATLILGLGLAAGNASAVSLGLAASVAALLLDAALVALAWEAVLGFLTLI